jgi:hypothetical protein
VQGRGGHFCAVERVSFPFISFIVIPWIRTGLQNPFGYGNIFSVDLLQDMEIVIL